MLIAHPTMIAEVIGRILLILILWGILLPISLVVMTPVVLVSAVLSQERFLASLRDGYLDIYEFWRDWLWRFLP